LLSFEKEKLRGGAKRRGKEVEHIRVLSREGRGREIYVRKKKKGGLLLPWVVVWGKKDEFPAGMGELVLRSSARGGGV